jgi:hypothetical protein
MATKRKKKKKESSEQYTFSDEVTKNRIKRHLNDIQDKITDEDIARVKIPGEESPPTNPAEQKEEKKEKTTPEPGGEGKPLTPWDIID